MAPPKTSTKADILPQERVAAYKRILQELARLLREP